MKIAIVDDESLAADLLASCLSGHVDSSAEITSFSSGEAFLEAWQPHEYSLIILDIFMDRMLGVDVAKEIRKRDTEVRLVFCTSSNEFASESYEVGASYYLLKPFTEEKLQLMLRRLDLDSMEQSLSVSLPGGQRILLQDILYTECFGHNITIRQAKQPALTVRMTQKRMEDLLCAHSGFVCCSKGIIVNLNAVIDLGEYRFLLNDHHTVPVSRRRRKEIQDIYAAFLFQKIRRKG